MRGVDHFVIRYLGKVAGFSPTYESALRLCSYLSESGDPATFERRDGPMPTDPDAEVAKLRDADALGFQNPSTGVFRRLPFLATA